MYHINPETGNPGKCRADPSNPKSRGCQFNKGEDQHYATKEEARASYERQQVKEVYGETMRANKAQLAAEAEARDRAEWKKADKRNRAIIRRFIDLKWKPRLTQMESAELRGLENGFEREAAQLAPEARAKFEADLRSMGPRDEPNFGGSSSTSFAMGEHIRYLNIKDRFADKPAPERVDY